MFSVQKFIFPVLLSLYSFHSLASNISPQQNSNNNFMETENSVLKISSISDTKNLIVDVAIGLLNTKYVFGGKSIKGIDCSGLVQYVYRKATGMNILGSAKDIAKLGLKIPKEHAFNGSLQKGDLLFFNTTGKQYSHVGIVIDKNTFIHASTGFKKVVIANINNPYFKNRLELIKRI